MGSPFCVDFTATLRYEPCTQFINVSQRTLHIYWQFSAMSHAIHKIVSKKSCQSYFISRRSPHHGISKDSDLCASAHRCPHYAYARLIARVTFKLAKQKYRPGSISQNSPGGIQGTINDCCSGLFRLVSGFGLFALFLTILSDVE